MKLNWNWIELLILTLACCLTTTNASSCPAAEDYSNFNATSIQQVSSSCIGDLDKHKFRQFAQQMQFLELLLTSGNNLSRIHIAMISLDVPERIKIRVLDLI
jgi:hypothetical protein